MNLCLCDVCPWMVLKHGVKRLMNENENDNDKIIAELYFAS